MKVILLQDIPKIGRKGDIKEISDGYARNFLLPKNLANFATPEIVKNAQIAKSKEEIKQKKQKQSVKTVLEKIKGQKIIIEEKADKGGRLFASINKNRIKKELAAKFGQIEEEDFKFDAPIKQIGEYKISVEKEGLKAEFILIINSLKTD
ncbi:MAG: 50S ribosomal protein L9 [Candidatus Niyogibacteria bacterium]|nr:50S ribosomal protein L9 [Candidatus Niyogibacteria bacterium]